MVAVLRDGDRLLAIRRAPGIVAGGAWCLPGGAIEAGETAAQAVVREVREEVGLAVRAVREIWRSVHREGTLELQWWLVECEACSPPLTLNPAEVGEARWLAPDAIGRLPGLLPSNLPFLEHWKAIAGELDAQAARRRTSGRLLTPQAFPADTEFP